MIKPLAHITERVAGRPLFIAVHEDTGAPEGLRYRLTFCHSLRWFGSETEAHAYARRTVRYLRQRKIRTGDL